MTDREERLVLTAAVGIEKGTWSFFWALARRHPLLALEAIRLLQK